MSPNRFVRPDMLACVHDGRRRLGVITGARLCLNRAGFRSDIANVAKASVDDFVSTINKHATAKDALTSDKTSASARSCLKALLFATANVPGIEGHRTRQRHVGLAMNLLFHPCVPFFAGQFRWHTISSRKRHVHWAWHSSLWTTSV